MDGNDSFKHLKANCLTHKINLLTRKGVYPYSFVDSFARFDERQLPHKQAFNDLLQEATSEEYFAHAMNVWTSFDMKTFGEYHDLYLKTDTLILCNVFENFRSFCLDYYKLDPCHYVSAPGVSWDAMLKMTGVELELITDPTMYCFFERNTGWHISNFPKVCKSDQQIRPRP